MNFFFEWSPYFTALDGVQIRCRPFDMTTGFRVFDAFLVTHEADMLLGVL